MATSKTRVTRYVSDRGVRTTVTTTGGHDDDVAQTTRTTSFQPWPNSSSGWLWFFVARVVRQRCAARQEQLEHDAGWWPRLQAQPSFVFAGMGAIALVAVVVVGMFNRFVLL